MGGTGRTSTRARTALAATTLAYASLEVLAGAPDSPLVPPLPLGTMAPDWNRTVARWMGLDRLGRTGLTVLALVLVTAAVAAFLVVVAEAWRARVSSRAVAVCAAIGLALVVAGPLLLSRDVYNYAAYGRMLALHDANPYVRPPSAFPADPFTSVLSPAWLHTRSVYGPVFTLVSAGVARTWSHSARATIDAFQVLAAAGVAGAAWLAALASARLGRRDRAPLAVALVALNPVMVLHTVGGGHNDALVALGVAGAAALAVVPGGEDARTRTTFRHVAVTAVLTVASLVKVVAVLPLALWIFVMIRSAAGPARRRAVAVHGALVLGVTVTATAPVFAGWRTISALVNLASRQGWAAGPRLVARGAVGLARWVGGSAAAPAVRTGIYGGFLLAFAMIVWRLARRAIERREPAGAGGAEDAGILDPAGLWGPALILFALAAPYLLPWYVAWFVPLLALMADERLAVIGVAVAAILALTGIPAEPGSAQDLWRWMVIGVHYVIAPVMLALFCLAVPLSLRAGEGEGSNLE